jgi:predicted N-acetyltransferase YhbS
LRKLSNSPLRAAQPADADAITRLINSAFQVENFFKRGDRLDLAEVEARFAKGRFILAEQHGVIVGCVYVEPGAERAYIGLLSVEPSLQGSGLGKRLMAAAEEYCRAAGCSFVDLRVVNLRTELPPFYRKLGYEQTGTEPFPAEAHTEIPCHFLIMSKAIPPRIQL